jgi:hypothetical protein
MPNWCFNQLTLRHLDPAMLEKAGDALRSGRLFATFLPEPDPSTRPVPTGTNEKTRQRLQAIAACDWRLRHWGTKWDCGPDGCFVHESDDGSLTCSFDTAWSPPVPFYRTLVELGYEVQACYHEPGMAFCGRFTNEGDDEYHEMPDTPALCVELIPADIRDVFNLPEDYYDSEPETVDTPTG